MYVRLSGKCRKCRGLWYELNQVFLHSEIRSRYQLGPAHHMTHIDNLDGILSSGEIKSYNRVNGAYTNIANDDVQAVRAAIMIPETKRPLHDYVPLYFGFKTPMVACNQHQNESIVFLRFSLDLLGECSGIVIANGNARSRGTKFQLYRGIDDLGILDTKAVLTVKYAHDPELKRRKQAEMLIPDGLPTSMILDIICFSEDARTTVITKQKRYGMSIATLVRRGWYFVPRLPT